MPLSFEEIRAKVQANLKTEDVLCPSLGGEVRIAMLGAEQKIALGLRYQGYPRDPSGKKLLREEDSAEFHALVVGASIVDEAGNRPFATPEGRQIINAIDSEDVMAIAVRAIALNGMDKDDPLEDAKKNSTAATTGSSPLPSADC